MANPAITPGSLTLTLTGVTIPAFPSLNITTPFFGKGFARLALEGEMTRHLPVAVGVVMSPQLYLMATLTVNLVKSQNLANLYKKQWETQTILGAVTVRTDSSVLSAFDLNQVGISDVREMTFNGDEADMIVTLKGQYFINSAIWP
jgi:hypothetical protein